MKILVFLRVIPIGTSSASLSNYVARVIRVIESMGLKYTITPFGTGIELESFNELSRLLEVVTSELRKTGVSRIAIDISLDLRFDKEITLEYKIESVKSKLTSIQ